MQRDLPVTTTSSFLELEFQSFADSSAVIRHDRSIFTAGQTLPDPDTGVTLHFRLFTQDIAEENASLSHYFRVSIRSEHSIKLRTVGK